MSNQMFLCQTSFSDIFFGLSSTEFHPPWIQTEGKDIFQSHPFPQSFTEVWKNIFVFFLKLIFHFLAILNLTFLSLLPK